MEHLQILDFEGNNVKDVEQLHYLKRLPKLEDVNLMHNPVQIEHPTSYYKLIRDSCQCLEVLDDEPITADFFASKLQI